MEYFSYLDYFHFSPMLLSGRTLAGVLLLYISGIVISRNIFGYSYFKSLILSLIYVILLITIIDYNKFYDTGNFILSRYKPNSISTPNSPYNDNDIVVADTTAAPNQNNSNENYEIVDSSDYNPTQKLPLPGTPGPNYDSRNNNQSNSKSSYDSNEKSSNSSDSYDETLKVISGGINLIRELSKNPNWEERDIPFTCTETGCGKTFTARGYYKETTNEFKPTVNFPTEWFHTHKWKILK